MHDHPSKLLASATEQGGRGFFTTVATLLTLPNWKQRKQAADAICAKLNAPLAEPLVRAFFTFMHTLAASKASPPSSTALSLALHCMSRPLTTAVVKVLIIVNSALHGSVC